MTNIEMISEMIIRVAKQEILPRFKNLEDADISTKSPGDLVTIADLQTEKVLTAELKELFPGAVIGGEEGIAKKPELLRAVITAEQGFLIDPVDGTNNFVKGDQRFALMLTELCKGMAVSAWIYLPVNDKIAVAEKGAGVYLGDKKIIISAGEFDPEHMIGAAHINRFPENFRADARENLKKFNQNRPAFCAGYDYISLIECKKDFSIYYRTLPWDHLPGSLILTEAGGYVRTLFGGEEYTVHDRDKGLLAAASKDHWQGIKEVVFPKLSVCP